MLCSWRWKHATCWKKTDWCVCTSIKLAAVDSSRACCWRYMLCSCGTPCFCATCICIDSMSHRHATMSSFRMMFRHCNSCCVAKSRGRWISIMNLALNFVEQIMNYLCTDSVLAGRLQFCYHVILVLPC